MKKTINFTPANNSEKLLATLPKECSCHMCKASKVEAKNQLGERRYNEVCKLLNIWAD